MMRKQESGNVIIFIFIAIGLLAALVFAFNASDRSSTALLTGVQVDAYTSEILSYGNDLKAAVKRLSLRGCSDTEISFESALTGTSYTNPGSPSNHSCHVFDLAGGGLTWQTPSENVFDSSISGDGQYFFPNLVAVTGLGNDCTDGSCTDLVVILAPLKQEICFAINKKFGLPVTQADIKDQIADFSNNYPINAFKGVYTYSTNATGSNIGGLGFGETFPPEYPAGCLYRADLGTPLYEFYMVLLAR